MDGSGASAPRHSVVGFSLREDLILAGPALRVGLMLARDEIIEVLFQALSDLKCVKAAWLAGSDAFNRADKWSDVDLRAVSSPDEFDAVFSAIENALKKISEIELMYVVPKSPTYAHRHRFYRLKNALPFNFVDFWCFQKEGLEAVSYTHLRAHET